MQTSPIESHLRAYESRQYATQAIPRDRAMEFKVVKTNFGWISYTPANVSQHSMRQSRLGFYKEKVFLMEKGLQKLEQLRHCIQVLKL
jgi:hypothetical protein